MCPCSKQGQVPWYVSTSGERWRWRPGVIAPLPIAGSGPVATTMRSTGPGQWPTVKSHKYKKGVSGWTWLLCHVKRENVAGTIMHGRHHIVWWHACHSSKLFTKTCNVTGAQKLYSSCRTVQVLPECLRLSKVPAVHCSIAIPLGQPGNPEITPLSRRVSQPDSLWSARGKRSMCAVFAAHGRPRLSHRECHWNAPV